MDGRKQGREEEREERGGGRREGRTGWREGRQGKMVQLSGMSTYCVPGTVPGTFMGILQCIAHNDLRHDRATIIDPFYR